MGRDSRKESLKLKDEQEEMTVLIFRFKGGGETLRKGFDTVTQAIRQIGPAAPTAPHRTLTPAAEGPNQPRQAAETNDAEDDSIDVSLAEDANENVNGDTPSQSRIPRPRKPPKMPTMLNNLDVSSGDVGLAQYAKQKKPDTLQEKFAVIGAWFWHYRQVQEITVDHIFTCFHLLDWPRPDDIGSIFRDLKSKKQWFEKGSKQNSWRLTIAGLNYVDNKLGKATE